MLFNICKLWRLCFVLPLFLISCGKDFLDAKPGTDIVVPTTLDEFKKLLDEYYYMNFTPLLGEVSSDDYYLKTIIEWNKHPAPIRNACLWLPDIYEGTEQIDDWNIPYTQVLNANVVLEGLKDVSITDMNRKDWNLLKGWALFVRAHAFYNLASLFAPPYDESTAAGDKGIPLHLSPNVRTYPRSSVKDTYDRIIKDLEEAVTFLPESLQTLNRNRPCQPAALALLSRVYLNMRNYEMALDYARRSLKMYDKIIDYNGTVSFASKSNDETLYQSEMAPGNFIFNAGVYPWYTTLIDSSLLRMYDANDLRLTRFYRRVSDTDTIRNQSYAGTTAPFGGLAVDELYLIKSECLARNQDISGAMAVLNALIKNRYKTNTFTGYTAGNKDEALHIIFSERRKELAFRGLRWQDLRRLNKEGANISLRRELGGKQYTIPPTGPLWVLPIPPDEIRMSKIEQNERE